MKRLYYILLTLILITALSGCNTGRSKPALTSNKLEKLVEMSPIIVECTATGGEKKISYDGIAFRKVDVKVKEVLREGYGITKNTTLTLLQSDDTTLIKKGETLILLLEKYEGPVTKDSYVIVGSEKGKIEISGNHIEPKTMKSGEYYVDVKKYDINSFKQLIKDKPYVSKQRTKEQIEEMNKNEKKLYESNKK